jgi:hypothetical protein
MTALGIASLGPASTDWNDFVGTAAADDLELTDTQHRSLYQLADLNPARWTIAAVDVVVGGRGPRAVVYAVDKQPTGVASYADLLEVADAQGELEVVAVELADLAGTDSYLDHLFRRVTVRLIARGLKDVPLVVVNRGRSSNHPDLASAPRNSL